MYFRHVSYIRPINFQSPNEIFIIDDKGDKSAANDAIENRYFFLILPEVSLRIVEKN